jgi:hypothetical protein
MSQGQRKDKFVNVANPGELVEVMEGSEFDHTFGVLQRVLAPVPQAEAHMSNGIVF